MKKLTLLLSLLFFSNVFLTAAQAAPCAEGRGYTLLCRGGYSVQNGGAATGTVFMSFGKSPYAAGSTGASLYPGTCAWEDRPLSASEPARVHGSVSTTSAGSQGWYSLVSQCAFDRNCSIELCVSTNSTATLLETMSNHAVIRFP